MCESYAECMRVERSAYRYSIGEGFLKCIYVLCINPFWKHIFPFLGKCFRNETACINKFAAIRKLCQFFFFFEKGERGSLSHISASTFPRLWKR